MANRYAIVTVNTTTFPAVGSPQITIPDGAPCRSISIVALDSSAANYIEWSYDGTVIEDRLVPTVQPGMVYEPLPRQFKRTIYLKGPNATTAKVKWE